MRYAALLALGLLAAGAWASDRGSLDIAAGGGAWIPGLVAEDSELSAGPGFVLGFETPMDQGNCIVLRTGYRMAGSDREGWSGLSAVPLTVGYRIFPFYRPYAGPRGLEPLMGVFGGGLLAWDSADDDALETTTTGGGLIGVELGARMKVGEDRFLDLVVRPEYAPTGSRLAGEDDKDLSGLSFGAALIF
jgi:hypothetical protein